MKRIQQILFLAFLTLTAIPALAQFAEVRGFVYDKKTGEPIIFTKVFLEGTTNGNASDVNGFYNLSKINPGSYILSSTGVGFDTVKIRITLKPGGRITQNIYLTQKSVNINTVDITADKTENLTETKVSVAKVTPKQINRIPSVGGEPDLAQYLQILPGVVFTGDQGGQLYIRGGSPIQNKVLLDGMIVYNPFHSIGLFSVFETDIIRNADVYTGGFGAEYGGRISAVMDITTRDGNKQKLSGKIGSNPFTSKILLEGPLSKYEEGKSTSSFILSGRTSYLERTAKNIYSYVDTAGLPYNFTDLYGKISFNSTNGSKLNLFGFKFTDQVNYKAPAAIAWNSTGFGGSFVVIPGSSSVLVDGSFAYSGYDISMKELTSKPRFSKINGFNAGLNFTYFIGKDELKYGIEMLGFQTDFQFTNAANTVIKQEQFTSEIAAFTKYKYASNRLILEPSIRAHYYASLAEMSIEPRFSAKYIITEFIRFKLASGFFSQNLLSAGSDRDIVNLFYGFLSGPEDAPKTFRGKPVTSKLQKARHIITGFEFDVTNRFQINVEGYIKQFDQLTNINRDKLYPNTDEYKDKPAYQREDYIIEDGVAKGIDFTFKYEKQNLYLWATYSLGYVSRYDGIRNYNPHYDRRHNVNIVGTYAFGKKHNWEFDCRWNLGSGFPFTQTQGFYEKILFENINSSYTEQNGQLGVIYGQLNLGRLPWYHRLDMSIKKKWEFSKNNVLETTLGVTNVYDRNNLFYFDRISYAKKYQLPFLPSFGITMTF